MKGSTPIFVTLSLMLAGCAAQAPDNVGTPASTETTLVPHSPSTNTRTPSATPATSASLPKPSRGKPAPSAGRPDVSVTILPDNEQEFMLRLEEIRADISSDEAFALAAGERVCLVIADRDATPEDVRVTAGREFSKEGASVTPPQAQQIADVVAESLCPDAG